MERHKIRNKIGEIIASMLTHRMLYWVVIRVWAKATTGTYSNKHPDEVTWSMAIKDLEIKK